MRGASIAPTSQHNTLHSIRTDPWTQAAFSGRTFAHASLAAMLFGAVSSGVVSRAGGGAENGPLAALL